jgi:uncharacterized membrane protein YfcA
LFELVVPTLPVTPFELVIALGLVTIGAIVQGSIGFGLVLVVAPVLMLVNRIFLPGPMIVSSMLLTTLIVHRDRQHIDWSDVSVCTSGRIAGMLPAALAVKFLTAQAYELMFSLAVLAGVLLSAVGWQVPLTMRNLFMTSVGSGFMSTVSAIGGPPLALVYQHEPAAKIRATLSAIFTLGSPISIVGLWWAGKFGMAEIVLGVVLCPAILVGFHLSRFTAGRLDPGHLRPAILGMSATTAVIVMVQALAHLLAADSAQ